MPPNYKKFPAILSLTVGYYADNPKISTIYVVRELLGFKSD